MANQDVYDLLVVVDATYSMHEYLRSLNDSLPKIISISALTNAFSRVGLIAYRDYCDKELIQWSGWIDFADPTADAMELELLKMAKNLEPIGGGDYPEATKTGLATAYASMRPEAETIILVYTDAPPHIKGSEDSEYFAKEQSALKNKSAEGKPNDDHHLFLDWVSACSTLAGEKRARVFSILEPNMKIKEGYYYSYLSEITGGACFYLNNRSPATISQVTIDLLLAWMQVEKPGAASQQIEAKLQQYTSIQPGLVVEDETLLMTSPYFDENHVHQLDLKTESNRQYLPKRAAPVQDFAERYKTDQPYRLLVVKQLGKIVKDDVSAISLNPVFGSLWRAVCNDRENPARDGLIQDFGASVEKIANASEKDRMKSWLEESYDYTAEVLEVIAKVPADKFFPCVYLDPTLKFERSADTDDGGSGSQPITRFTRGELLEIGRSCDNTILHRLGRVLTQLSFADTEKDIPSHIAKSDQDKLIKIPLALATHEFQRKFWKILLHIVVPGTMLSARPAALLAALSIRLGIQPLQAAADQEVLFWRDKWNNLEIPETWNMSCLSLLLDANKIYLERNSSASEDESGSVTGLLVENDRALFERLVDYKMLELNMKTTLTAKVGWKPDKTSMPIGPVVMCDVCAYPRSVTMMGSGNTCGICEWDSYASSEEQKAWTDSGVSKDDTETSSATWVECSVASCHAQYIVYHAAELRVRPKCFYCRGQSALPEAKRKLSPAPTVSCETCLNRVIWPEHHRPASMTEFFCVACTSGKKTIVDAETCAKDLCNENGEDWLFTNRQAKIKFPFRGRSLFHTISTAGTDSFCDLVEILPPPTTNGPLALVLHGKPIHNPTAMRAELVSWIQRRRAQDATCSLCFSSGRKDTILPTCGRTGCHQRTCRDCLKGWYGLNESGRIINTAALSCPFCRRAPTGRTLSKYGMGVHAVGDLRVAVEQAGVWIFAWCHDCGKAKPFMERVCAAGAPDEVTDWKCDECRPAKRMRAVKSCPGCGVLTEKSSGCDHIHCVVEDCGMHWCFFCGEASGEDEIYEHMMIKHGGYYNGEDEEDHEVQEDHEDDFYEIQ
jgi:hypothetical protein